MPMFNVQRPDGMWAVFSSVVDDYITDWMTEENLNAWRAKEYGEAMCDLKYANKMDYEEAEMYIREAEEAFFEEYVDV